MDHNLREMGVGDLAVPKEMQRMGEAFYGRTQAYRAALATDEQETLAAVLARNIYDSVPASQAAASHLAAYMWEAVRDLNDQTPAALRAGELHLPDPAAVLFVEDKGPGLKD